MLPKTFSPPKEIEKKAGFPKIFKVLIIIILLIGGVSYFLFFTSIFQVKNIITDNTIPENSKVILDKLKGQNIFFVNLSSVKKEIINITPELEKIKIQKGLPDTLKVTGQYYQSKIVWKSGGRSYLLNSDGVVIKEVEGATDLPIVLDNKDLAVSLGRQVISKNFIDFILEVYSQFADKIGFKIVNFEIDETVFHVKALTDQGWYIKFDTTRNYQNQLDDLSKFLAEKNLEIREYVDVRVEGRIYYK